MELYLDSDSIKLWDVILDGWEPPKAKIDDVEVTFKRSQWNQTQKMRTTKERAIITLLSSISREEGGKVQHY